MNRRLILLVLTVLLLVVVVSRFTELEDLRNTLIHAQGQWVLAALFSQMVYYTVFTASYQAAFSAVGIRMRTRELIPVTLGSLFVNVVVPAGVAGGTVLFAEHLARQGKSGARAATGVLLQLISDFGAFVILLIPGMAYLFLEHDLRGYEIVAALVLLLLTMGLNGILLLGMRKPDRLRRFLAWIQRTANRNFGRLNRSLALPDNWAQTNADEFTQAAAVVAAHPSRLLLTVIVALIAHIVDISTLYILFRAFNHTIGLGALIAGYAMGILFWIVSITPQGIGVVEGMMALTFASLGIPGAVAAAVALTFRGLTFWIPMSLGFFAVQRMHAFGEDRRLLTEVWGVRFAAVLVAVMGMVNVFSAVTPAAMERVKLLEQFSPLAVRHGGHLTAALAGFALVVLAGGLWRRKHVAWLLTLGALGISFFSHLAKGLDYEESLLAFALMITLWMMRPHFHARSDRPSLVQGLRVLALAFVFTLAYGVIGLYLLDRHYSVNFGLWDALRQTIVMFAQFYDPGLNPVTSFGRYFADSIYIVGAVTAGYAGIMLLRPVFMREPATQEERVHAQAIVEKHGRSSLARLLLLEDKRYLFSPGGSVIGYAQVGRTAVALGDPVGPSGDLLPSIEAFTALCRSNDWLPVFYQTMPDTLGLYKRAGFEAICIGEEGIVNLQTFTLDGRAGKGLRSPINKLTSAGHSFELHQPPIPDDLLEKLRAISDEWLTMMHGSEKRFSLGWFEDEYVRNSPIGVVYTPEGWISAFANLITEYQLDEITIDLMRRRHKIENGTMEFLFVSLFQSAKAQGYKSFNLGLSALSGVGAHSGDPAVERTMHFLYEHVNQFYNFKGLHNFKEKFHPEWSPRYLIFPGSVNLPQAWLSVVLADSGRSGIFTRLGWR